MSDAPLSDSTEDVGRFRYPDIFNHVAHSETNSRVGKYAETREDVWFSFASAWNAMELRLRAAVEYHATLATLVEISTAPGGEERYRQEFALFGFLTSALSALECTFFAVHCVAAIVDPSTFPLSKDADLNFSARDVLDRFTKRFPDHTLTQAMAGTLNEPSFQELSDFRNMLTHRGILPRKHYFSTIGDTPSTVPLNPKSLATAWQYTVPLFPSPTGRLLQFTSHRLGTLLSAVAEFARDNI